MVEKSIFLIKNGFVLYSSFRLIIFIILLCMHGVSGVCCQSSGLLSIDSSLGVSVDFWWEMSIDVAV